MYRTALKSVRNAFWASHGLSSRRSRVDVLQALSSASVRNFSKEHDPNEDEAQKEDYIAHPMPEVPASVRDHLDEEKWPHASDEERRSDMRRPEDAEMPTQFSPTPDPNEDETPERKKMS